MLRVIAISLAVSIGFFAVIILVEGLVTQPETLEGSVITFSDIKTEGMIVADDVEVEEFGQALSKTGEIIEKGEYTQILTEDGTIIDFSY